jgi:hypothetical protein
VGVLGPVGTGVLGDGTRPAVDGAGVAGRGEVPGAGVDEPGDGVAGAGTPSRGVGAAEISSSGGTGVPGVGSPVGGLGGSRYASSPTSSGAA